MICHRKKKYYKKTIPWFFVAVFVIQAPRGLFYGEKKMTLPERERERCTLDRDEQRGRERDGAGERER